jgi:ankyrin repeat protein
MSPSSKRKRSEGLPHPLMVLCDHVLVSEDDLPPSVNRAFASLILAAGSKRDACSLSGVLDKGMRLARDARRLAFYKSYFFKNIDEARNRVILALETGAIDANAQSEGGWVLRNACRGGDARVVKEVIRNFRGPVPVVDMLSKALLETFYTDLDDHPVRFTSIVEDLLNAGADPRRGFADCNGQTVLHCAAAHKSRRAMDILLRCCQFTHEDAARKSAHGNTPLHEAHFPSVVDYLVDVLHADVEAQNDSGETPLSTMARCSTLTAMKTLMKKCSPTVQAVALQNMVRRQWDRYGPTFTDIFEKMMQQLDPTEKKRILRPGGGVGRTLLHDARSEYITKLLIHHGANPDAVDPQTGWTPIMDVVARARDVSRNSYTTVEKIMRLLIKAGCKLDVCDHQGRTVTALAQPCPMLLTMMPSIVQQ